MIFVFAADHCICTGLRAHKAIAGGIHKDICRKEEFLFRCHLDGLQALNLPGVTVRYLTVLTLANWFRHDPGHMGIQIKVQAILEGCFLPEDAVENCPTHPGIAVLMLQEDLLQDPCLPRIRPGAVVIGSADMHADLRAGIAANHRAILDQRHPDTFSGCGNGAA